MPHQLCTLVFPRRGAQVLLGMKKCGFGKGLWNGFGGKVEGTETILKAAVREIKEECGLAVEEKNLNFIGNLKLHYQGGAQIMTVKIFNTYAFEGNAVETKEMEPRWFNVSSIPFKDMWPDDVYWFPHLLKENTFSATFWYQGYTKIIRKEVRQISNQELQCLD